MTPLTQAIYNRMAGDTTLTSMLSVYRGSPAIFTADPVPPDAKRPFIVAAGAVNDSAFDTKTSRGREVSRDIRVYTDATGSFAGLEQISDRVRTLFHRYAIAVIGFSTLVAQASGPTVVPTDPQVQGMSVSVRWILETT
jgi:hypothetical protein